MNKTTLIISNSNKDKDNKLAYKIKEYLESKDIDSIVLSTKTCNEEIDNNYLISLIISIGGDGTVLYASKFAYKYNVPILPINMGTFGYITGINKTEWKETLNLYLDNKAEFSPRMMIEYFVIRKNKVINNGVCLNDVVVTANGLSKIAQMDLRIQNTKAGSFKSDGFIISSPTGSTGYALAGGGPIVEPSIEALIIVSICPFTLSNRPIVVNSDHEIEVQVSKNNEHMILTCDGIGVNNLNPGDIIRCKKADKKVLLIKSSLRTYYEVVRDKLNWGGSF